jgi:hypothetical protein
LALNVPFPPVDRASAIAYINALNSLYAVKAGLKEKVGNDFDSATPIPSFVLCTDHQLPRCTHTPHCTTPATLHAIRHDLHDLPRCTGYPVDTFKLWPAMSHRGSKRTQCQTDQLLELEQLKIPHHTGGRLQKKPLVTLFAMNLL